MVLDYDNTPFLGLSQMILWPLVYTALSDPTNQGEDEEVSEGTFPAYLLITSESSAR